MEDKIYLTIDGFEELKNEINILKEKLKAIQNEKSEACSGAIGDGWHDNFAYEDAERRENSVIAQINKLMVQSNNIEIIENEDIIDDIVCIGDKVDLEFLYESGDSDTDCFRLTGNWKYNEYDDYQEITLNSPLGNAIYKQKIGSSVEYVVNEKRIKVTILKKL